MHVENATLAPAKSESVSNVGLSDKVCLPFQMLLKREYVITRAYLYREDAQNSVRLLDISN